MRALTLGASALATLLTSIVHAEDARICRPGEADTAIQRVMKRVEEARLYEGRLLPACLSFLSLCASGHVLISIHEKHNEACGGDPSTSPAIDHFKIHKTSGSIQWMDVASGDYLPFERLCAHTTCAKPVTEPAQSPAGG
jgi:hypothetical protein